MDGLKLLAVLLAIIFALRKKLPVGITLFCAGLLTAILYQIAPAMLLEGYWNLLRSGRFLSLTAVIMLITMLGRLLKELGYLERLAQSCRHLYGGRRTAVAILPFLIGLMPMPGGALLSAPLVNDVLKDKKYTPEFRTVSNYWFRHLVEFFWPVYPGIILTEGITGLAMGKVALLQFPLSLFMLAVGAYFYSRRIDKEDGKTVRVWHSLSGIVGSIWPIAGAIAIFAVFRIDLSLAVLTAMLLLIIFVRPHKNAIWSSAKSGLSYKLIFLMFGTLSFQTVLELSGAIRSIPALATTYHFPPELLIVFVCFTLGILTGMVAAYVGMGYTLLAGFMYQPTIMPGHILLGYLSGYIGMLLSPTHLCLILTNEYFGSNLSLVYRRIALPVILLGLFGFLLSRSPWIGLF